jgi:CHAD domain-containing protein
MVIDERFPDPTAAMVVHRMLAMAARTFLLNDMVDDGTPKSAVDSLTMALGPRPLWGQSTARSLRGTERRPDRLERVHQSRVAMRRIRSNLRTFRLLCDPTWGTSLRAELAWYGNCLGQARDLNIIRELITDKGPDVMAPEHVARLDELLTVKMADALKDIAAQRGGARRFQLTEQMMVLWDGPAFKPKAARPAREVLPQMLHRAWHDVRGASRTARQDPSDINLHKLRIRVKDLRYGCNTVALVEGGGARKTAKATEQLQVKLGDLHDAVFSIEWLRALALEHLDLAEPIRELVLTQQDVAAVARKGWKRDVKEIERRWRKWQG